jgi:polysaccharide biosynthesis protein PslF
MPESYGFLSTYPPTQCGLATFTASLATALQAGPGTPRIGVVRVAERDDGRSPAEVVGQVITTEPGAEAAAADALNQLDVAIVQHEYGIYGGRDGDSVIEIIRRLRVPSIVVLHTVLTAPTHHQRLVLEQVARAASVVVVMTETARGRLLDGYQVEASKVELIAHGAPTEWVAADPAKSDGRCSVLTWGLISPDKGIEWVVGALPALRDIQPPVHYTVAGQTHPQVLERHGEAYRTMVEDRAEALGVSDMLHFDNRYLDQASLGALVRNADVVVLPYNSADQVTSGVLTEAVSARCPVVATGFSHAVELLAGGAGLIVDHRDPTGIAAAIRRILTVPGVATSMRAAADGLVADLSWATVCERYRELGERLTQTAQSVSA